MYKSPPRGDVFIPLGVGPLARRNLVLNLAVYVDRNASLTVTLCTRSVVYQDDVAPFTS